MFLYSEVPASGLLSCIGFIGGHFSSATSICMTRVSIGCRLETLLNTKILCINVFISATDETLPINVLCGVLSGVISSSIANPTDVLKVRIPEE